MSLPELVCACANLRRATRAITQIYDEEVRATGLRITQLGLLKAIGTVRDVGQGRLGYVMGMDSTTLTRTLAPLRRRGLVEVRPGADRRERRLSLTAKGRAKVEEMTPHWERAQRRLREAVGKDYDQLQGLLYRVAQLGAPE
jgi:DNA-binding MarR family transcriptional regulator